MPNLMDYLAWRGDLTFDQAPLCQVDQLIFAQLAYVSFGDAVPGVEAYPGAVRLERAARWLLDTDPEGRRIHQTFYMWKDDREMLRALADAPRFRNVEMLLSMDEMTGSTQFAAVAYRLPNGRCLVAFRGTDDSVSGWKEDCMLALDEPVPAQLRAAEYLRTAAEKLPGTLELTGHSKGGNLAVYAAASVEAGVQARIRAVYNLDGPGFSRSLLSSPGYAAIRDRVRTFLPEGSVVGRLLAHDGPAFPVRSDAAGLMQHSAFSWQVTGSRMLPAENLSLFSEYVHGVMDTWIDSLSAAQRREFVENLFEMIGTLQVDTLDEARTAIVRRLPTFLHRMRLIDREKKVQLLHALFSLGGTALNQLPRRFGGGKKGDTAPGDGSEQREEQT
ncbi:MAG: DUF2974 domain-containing protein [Clostridiales bacterium]|nr:DUF2974 domain-containing protein [Clostridiales bacterium]